MSKENIIKNNELIAEFMGGKYETNLPFAYTKSGWTDTPANSSNQIVQSHTFKYNSSWDWLMPVIEKIQKLGYVCVIYGNYCNIIEKDLFTKKYDGEGFNIDYYSESIDNVIEAVYKCAIEFIKWYNQNK